MRMQKPYEEGSILLDAPQHDTMDELVSRARSRQGGVAGDIERHLPCKTIDYINTRENQIGTPISI